MKLKATFETEVYINDRGYIAIRQRDPLEPDPQDAQAEQIVELSPQQAQLVAAQLKAFAEEFGNEWHMVDERPQKPA